MAKPIIAGAIIVVGVILCFPLYNLARYRADINHCKNNLKHLCILAADVTKEISFSEPEDPGQEPEDKESQEYKEWQEQTEKVQKWKARIDSAGTGRKFWAFVLNERKRNDTTALSPLFCPFTGHKPDGQLTEDRIDYLGPSNNLVARLIAEKQPLDNVLIAADIEGNHPNGSCNGLLATIKFKKSKRGAAPEIEYKHVVQELNEAERSQAYSTLSK